MMIRGIIYFWLLAFLGAVSALGQHDFAEDRVIIRFNPETVSGLTGTDLAGTSDLVLDRMGLSGRPILFESRFALHKAVKQGDAATREAARSARIDFNRDLFLSVPAGQTVEELVEELQAHDLVAYAEPDYIGSGGETIPNDTSFASQWWHRNTISTNADISTAEAWDITQGNTGVVVAVLDTGLAMSLPEFSNRWVSGFDFVNNDSDPTDDHNHGTAVSSVIGANANNEYQLAGVDWNCRIMPLKVLNASNNGFYSDWRDAIYWGVSNGAQVLNLSAGGSSSSLTLSNAIMWAIEQGAVFVTITHNDNSTTRFPGRMLSCLTVSASNSNDARSSFSNYGEANDLIAPGQGMTVLLKSGSLDGNWYGTSFSAPQVSAAAALMLGLYPGLTHHEVEQILRSTVDDEVGTGGVDTEGFDIYHGSGRMNLYRALQYITNRAPDEVLLIPATIDGALTPLESYTWRTNSPDRNIYAWFNGEDLYVASEDARSGNDHFIMVTDQFGPMTNAPWAKSGQVPGVKAFLADENDNQYRAWFIDSSENTNHPAMTAEIGNNVIEGTINLVDVFGYIPANVYIALAPFSTADSGALVSGSQVPPGNGDGNLDSNEFYCLNLLEFDTDRDGVPDLLEDYNANGTVDAGEPSPRIVDSDGDSLPDGEEVNTYGSDPASVDTDGDGQLDPEEAFAGTSLVNSNDRFQVASVLYAGAVPSMEFSWETITGRFYHVESFPGYIGQSGVEWTNQAEDILGTGGTMVFTNTWSLTNQGFRIRVSR